MMHEKWFKKEVFTLPFISGGKLKKVTNGARGRMRPIFSSD